MVSSGPTVTVVGGSGRTGRLIVAGLLGDHHVRVLSRHPTASQGVESRTGSITDETAVNSAVQDADGVVIIVESANDDRSPNGPTAVHRDGVGNVSKAVGVRTHIVLVTQIYITRPEAYPSAATITAARAAGEELVRTSGRPYTIVRPAWLTNDEDVDAVVLRQGDRDEGHVGRPQVAHACVQSLRHQSARGKTFELYSATQSRIDDWNTAFGNLVPDRLA